MGEVERAVVWDIDTVLSPIARELSHRADTILDLREAAAQRSDPGMCISCYFKLLASAHPHIKPVATPLREWLEAHLEVVARDSNLRELERVPIQLETDEMEAYCHRIMNEFRYDRAYQDAPMIELSFRFKEPLATA
jgi:hypothetical protein